MGFLKKTVGTQHALPLWKLPVASHCIETKIQPPRHLALDALEERPPLWPESLHLLNRGNDPCPHRTAVRMRGPTPISQLLPPLFPAPNKLHLLPSFCQDPGVVGSLLSPQHLPAPFPFISSCAVNLSPKCRRLWSQATRPPSWSRSVLSSLLTELSELWSETIRKEHSAPNTHPFFKSLPSCRHSCGSVG